MIAEPLPINGYPYWVCQDCGFKASGGRQFDVSTWHIDTCEVCGEWKPCTEPRDFFYPKFEDETE